MAKATGKSYTVTNDSLGAINGKGPWDRGAEVYASDLGDSDNIDRMVSLGALRLTSDVPAADGADGTIVNTVTDLPVNPAATVPEGEPSITPSNPA